LQQLSEQLRTRTRDEVLDFAYSRGTRLRRQRLVVRSAAAAVVVLAAAIPVALVMADGTTRDPQDVQVVDMPSTTTIPADSDTLVEPDKNGALGPVPTSGGAAASQAAAPARSVINPPVGDHSRPGPAQPQLEECGASEVALTTLTDKASYLPTETVTVTARIRNTSKHPCLAVTSGDLAIHNDAGVRQFSDQKPVPNVSVWQPNQTIELVFRWTPCGEPPCQFSNGTHTARVVWQGPGDYSPSTASFTIGVS